MRYPHDDIAQCNNTTPVPSTQVNILSILIYIANTKYIKEN